MLGCAAAHVEERLTALDAHIHVFPRVCKDEVLVHVNGLSMLAEIVQTREPLQAQVALERALTGVLSDVPRQVLRPGKGHGAVRETRAPVDALLALSASSGFGRRRQWGRAWRWRWGVRISASARISTSVSASISALLPRTLGWLGRAADGTGRGCGS